MTSLGSTGGLVPAYNNHEPEPVAEDSPEARIRAAVAILDRLIAETVETGKISHETQIMALKMLAPTARILRHDLALFTPDLTAEMRQRIERATVSAGDLALADAILSGVHIGGEQ